MMPQTKIILFTMHGDNVGETLTATADIDLVLSKTDGIVKLEEHLNALLTPTVDTQAATKVPLSPLSADATPNQSLFQTEPPSANR